MPSKNLIKNISFQNLTTSQTNKPWAPNDFDFDHLLEPFGHPFSITFHNHPNLLNCNMSPAKTFFLPDQALEFGHRKFIEAHISSRRDSEFHFSYSIRFPSKSSGHPNGTNNLLCDAKTSIKSDRGMDFSSPQSAPGVHL